MAAFIILFNTNLFIRSQCSQISAFSRKDNTPVVTAVKQTAFFQRFHQLYGQIYI